MDPQQPPSEREWTIEEQEEFFASQDAITGLFPGAVAANGPPVASTEPLTLDRLVEMKKKFDEQFPEPIKFKNGADMSPETWAALKHVIPSHSFDNKSIHAFFTPTVFGVEVHLVPGIPFGDVEECRCAERDKKIKFQMHTPLSPCPYPSMMEFTKNVSIEEVKKRWPDEPVRGPHLLTARDGEQDYCGGPGACKWCDGEEKK